MIADHHTLCWKWEENQNKVFSETRSETASKTFWSAWCDINRFKLGIVCALISPRVQNLLKVSSSSSRITRKNIQSPSGPTWGLSSVEVYQYFLNFLYVCPAFLSNWFCSFSILMAHLVSFSALRLPVFFLCGKIYIIWFIQCRHVGITKWRNLLIRNVWIRIIN